MSDVVVWTERRELHGTYLRDCAYSGALMCLVYASFKGYPLGIYTPEEREALERSDDRPDETGASMADITVAVKRRYNLALHVPETTNGATELGKVGRAYVVAGTNGHLPAGHHLRRWDPTFTGGHDITMVPQGGGKVLWLDPEATALYPGELVDVATALLWSDKPFNARYTNVDEYAISGGVGGGIDIMGLAVTLPAAAVAGTLAIPYHTDAINVATGVHYAVPQVVSRPAYVASLAAPLSSLGYLVDLDGDVMHFIRAGQAGLVFTPAALPAPPAADCTAEVAAAHAAGYAEAKSAAEAAVGGI